MVYSGHWRVILPSKIVFVSTAVLSAEHCCAECRALLCWVPSTAVVSLEHCCAECRALLCWVPSTAVLSAEHCCCAECWALLCWVPSTAAVLSAEHCCILTDHKKRESTALHKKETKAKTSVRERTPVKMMNQNNPSNDDGETQLPLHDIRLCMYSTVDHGS